jgi:hypothetical protein
MSPLLRGDRDAPRAHGGNALDVSGKQRLVGARRPSLLA